jgi:hypothetical protein
MLSTLKGLAREKPFQGLKDLLVAFIPRVVAALQPFYEAGSYQEEFGC